MQRGSWRSKLGFIFAAAGSAVGLANVWRFPYIVGKYGGAAFICVYLICLFLIGFPVFVSEILIGKTTQKNPAAAFKKLGQDAFWKGGGLLTVITGFIISAFYSVIAGWVLGYLISAFLGQLTHFSDVGQVEHYFKHLVSSPYWGVGFHFLFITLCFGLLFLGVRKGLEKGSKIMVPFLILILLGLAITGLTLSGAKEGLIFYFKPNWSLITPTACLMALGHSFFTLSLGQGTMVTYGSYLTHHEGIPKNCLPVALLDTFVALLAGFAIFPIVFTVGLSPTEGPALIFYTLPLVFSQFKAGYLLAVLFFLLLVLAALTSEISALEPMIAYLVDERKWSRKKAVFWVCLCAFLLGIPIALSNFIAPSFLVFKHNLFDLVSFIALDVLVPIGGFLAVALVAWKWGFQKAYKELKKGSGALFEHNSWVKSYFAWTLRYTAPLLVLLIFLKAIGVF